MTTLLAPPARFTALVTAVSVSAFGNFLNLVALSLFTYAVTGSAWGLGLVMAARLTAGFAGGLVAPSLVRLLGLRRLMMSSDLAQAVVMCALAALGSSAGLPGLVVTALVLGAGNSISNVCVRASVPDLVPEGENARSNGRLVTWRALAVIAGYASASTIIAFGGFVLAFSVNAASFAFSAFVVSRLRWNESLPPVRRASGPSASLLRAVGPAIAVLVAVRAADAFGSASHNLSLPVHASAVAGADAAVFMSGFWASWAVGAFTARFVAPRFAHSTTAFVVGTCVMSASFVLAFTGPPWPVLILVMVCAGFSDGLTEIVYTSRLQEVHGDLRVRLFGLSSTAETAGFASGTLVASALLPTLPVLGVVAGFHTVAVVCALALALVSRRLT
ncbi:MFS transporter [Lentzea albida]|uniref:Major Facilitator Superfamily protein n=1 Tax=Lentzea albida TaxID=65499 RepID=A0A1H9WH94_9PSEU|nr:MFS transporter [Lentzea albida]SES33270.1 Major Facilitator Superfamily protein [Lentzea albida]